MPPPLQSPWLAAPAIIPVAKQNSHGYKLLHKNYYIKVLVAHREDGKVVPNLLMPSSPGGRDHVEVVIEAPSRSSQIPLNHFFAPPHPKLNGHQ